MNRHAVLALIALSVFTFASLFGGAPYLEWELPGGLPLGNALTAIGLSSGAVAAIVVSRPGTVIRWLAIASLTLTVTWLPVSIMLAGNLALNFNEQTGPVWILLSLITIGLAFVSLVIAVGQFRSTVVFDRRTASGS